MVISVREDRSTIRNLPSKMVDAITSAPVLSTPDNHILTETEPALIFQNAQQLSEDEFSVRYEIDRTLSEIQRHGWKRVALQFPDHLLPHSTRVFQILSRGGTTRQPTKNSIRQTSSDSSVHGHSTQSTVLKQGTPPTKFTILADTSYGSCCVDEIAAEHVNADAVVHYGRACLSPTARLPVIHVFTYMPLDLDQTKQAFISTFSDPEVHIIITADIPYANHIEPLTTALANSNYNNLYPATIIHNPSSAIPNRTVPQSVSEDPSSLSSWHIFHIAEPPTALLLTLSSRVASIRIYSPSTLDLSSSTQPIEANTTQILRRRYALVTSMSTVSTWGILINTLSVKNYLHVVEHVKQQITNAGKKFYLFVVGKINAAKLANFSEIEGWVIIGCWESSLIDSKDFFRPILTPFELELALTRDEQRVWSGAWSSDFQGLLDRGSKTAKTTGGQLHDTINDSESSRDQYPDEDGAEDEDGEIDLDSEEESAPPEFDLRTGKYVSQPLPIRNSRRRRGQKTQATINHEAAVNGSKSSLMRRPEGNVIAVNGVASPAGEFLREKRTWKGLGSDFEIRYEDEQENIEGSLMEEGRSGVAGGYNTTGDSERR